MPPNNIVRDVRVLIQNKLLPQVPKKWAPQFTFGMQAFSLRPFQSANSNARMAVGNAATASTKCDRLLANVRLAAHLGVAFDTLKLVRPGSFINIDHSDMHGLTALVGAVQTRKGAALPCLVEATYAQHIPAAGSQKSTPRGQRLRAAMVLARRTQSFTGHTIDALQGFADRLGFWPRLVFDRGFGNESLITHLAAEGCLFYVRMKAGRLVELDGHQTKIQHIAEKDSTIGLYGLTLRVIRSPKSRRATEPWYILTNDMSSSQTKVVRIYYHRFEIEETFKDMKHVFELKRTRLNRPNSLKVLLWFVCLGIALLYLATKPTKQQTTATHSKKQTSWLRQAYEQLQQAYGLLLWGDDG